MRVPYEVPRLHTVDHHVEQIPLRSGFRAAIDKVESNVSESKLMFVYTNEIVRQKPNSNSIHSSPLLCSCHALAVLLSSRMPGTLLTVSSVFLCIRQNADILNILKSLMHSKWFYKTVTLSRSSSTNAKTQLVQCRLIWN